MSRRLLRQLKLAVGLLFIFASLTGCKKQELIDKVTFTPSENLEVIRVALVFKKDVNLNLSTTFILKEYGSLFVNAATASTPFEVGFNLNTSIINDQEYAHFEPVEHLPNGASLGIGYPVVEIRSPEPVSADFDIFGYVDVTHGSWLGAATMFKFTNNPYFPIGMTVTKAFLQDSEGRPGVLASVFGPMFNSDGSVKRSGGIALMANIKQVLELGVLVPNQQVSFLPVQ